MDFISQLSIQTIVLCVFAIFALIMSIIGIISGARKKEGALVAFAIAFLAAAVISGISAASITMNDRTLSDNVITIDNQQSKISELESKLSKTQGADGASGYSELKIQFKGGTEKTYNVNAGSNALIILDGTPADVDVIIEK